MCRKNFIWRNKFTSKDLTLISYQKYLYQKLTEMKNAYILMGKMYKFDKWNNIYDCMSRLPECCALTVALWPAQAPAGTAPQDQPPTE